jgi:hypothetical protein
LKKINKTDKLLAKLTRTKREKTHVNKIRDEIGNNTQIPMKLRDSLGSILKMYIPINWKI